MARNTQRWKHRKRSLRRPQTLGTAPGTLVVDPQSSAMVIRAIGYGPDGLDERILASADDARALLERWPVTWINVDGLGHAEALQQFGKVFGLHPLALEDTVNTHQRAKADDFGDVLFVTSRMVQGPPLLSEQLSLFVGANFVLSFQEDLNGDCLDPIRERIRLGRGRVRSSGPDYLLYEILDAVIDGFFPVVERFGEELDDLDSGLTTRHMTTRPGQIHRVRSDLLYLRRIVWPHRDMLQMLLRSSHTRVSPETMPYLADCYDHVIQLIDILEVYRETCSDLRDFYYSQLSNRTNDIMRTLTVLSTVFLPMTFIAGVYGMNFEYMPELSWRWGYPFSLVVMGGVGIAFLAFVWRKGWLERWDKPPGSPRDHDHSATGD